MKDVESLFKSFLYAFKGFGWMVTHERNFRIHLSCLAYMFYYLLRYDFFTVSRTEFAILFLASGLVIGGEMLNTGVEKADDSVSKEKKHTIEISKDVSAGAVLVFAIFAVLCGVVILWQPEAFKMLFSHYAENPLNILWFVLSVVAFTLFIFKFDFSKKKK
ncbi:MAG: diacylglycerol kinase family protein [Acutalibacteraceae bacterium]|nr:diacylglycerol kinase family protein [Acutalibacteraceae bacterium]